MSYPYQITSLEQYKQAYQKSVEQPEAFWDEVANSFYWRKKWDKTLEWNFKEPDVKWFQGGKLNITENCIDRHLKEMGDKPAIIWEPNNPEDRVRVVTYNRLHKRVCQFAQVLINNGVKKGDRVCIYMGMVPELAYAVLGCATNRGHSQCDLWRLFCTEHCRPAGRCKGGIHCNLRWRLPRRKSNPAERCD